MNFILTDTGITVFANAIRYSIPATHPQYTILNKAIGERNQELFDSILVGLQSPKIIKKAAEAGIVIKNGNVFYNGQVVEDVFADKLSSLFKQGFENLDGYKNYLANLMENPSASSRAELSDFLRYKELAITPDGHFLAYKGVNEDYWSCHGNSKTKVKSGKVNRFGQILNSIGSLIEVDRGQVDDNRNKHCSFGLHIGSLDFVRGYAKIVVVKVNPRDVVSVPNDCSCQKARVCAYEVVEDFSKEIVAAQVSIEEGKIIEKENENNTVFSEDGVISTKIKNYIENKLAAGIQPTLRQIKNAVRRRAGINLIEAQSIVSKSGYKIDFAEHLGNSKVFKS